MGNDLIIVNHDLWHRIRSICDVVSGSEIERKVVEDSDGFMRVEIYPFDFQICVCDSAGKLRLSLVNVSRDAFSLDPAVDSSREPPLNHLGIL